MKGSPVRVRASASKKTCKTHTSVFCLGDELCARTRPLCDKRLFRAPLAHGGSRTPAAGEAGHRVGRPSDWCSRLVLRSRPASEHGSAAIRSVAASAGDLWTSLQRSAFATATTRACFGQEQSSGELQPTRLLLVRSGPVWSALLLGAPFWFDLLGKVAHLRSTGAKPPESSTM
jgi:hypothetical protein